MVIAGARKVKYNNLGKEIISTLSKQGRAASLAYLDVYRIAVVSPFS